MLDDYREVRNRTLDIVEPLSVEDCTVQSCPEASPAKWHLAHTTWFFERLVLQEFQANYQAYDSRFYNLFNSYYQTLSLPWARQDRGLLSRPSVEDILKYRHAIDDLMFDFLSSPLLPEQQARVRLGLEHEQQHQELLYMDIQNLFSVQQPPVTYRKKAFSEDILKTPPLRFKKFKEELVEIGAEDKGSFSYDNEGPVHKHYLRSFALASRLSTNGEYLEFIESGGYQKPEYWHADGWNWVLESKIESPLYWKKQKGRWFEFDLQGERELQLAQPVSHVGFYEASAFARFCDRRLPTEFEWEFACKKLDIYQGPFLERSDLGKAVSQEDFADMCGVLWQWTQSSYLPYPGHKWQAGPLGEYNSKFMVNQQVLRGGSFATPRGHFRPTYRNYFYPHQRWAFCGIRLAEDL